MKQKQFQEFVINHLTKQSEDIESLTNNVSSLSIRTTEQEKYLEFAVKHLMKQSEDINSLKIDVSSLKSDMTMLNNTVLRIETRIENEIIGKIEILFDGHKQHDDRLIQHDDRLDRIEKISAG